MYGGKEQNTCTVQSNEVFGLQVVETLGLLGSFVDLVETLSCTFTLFTPLFIFLMANIKL